MKQTNDLEQLIDRAIANDRGALPQQPPAPPADLITRVSATPATATHAAISTSAGISVAVKVGIVALVAAGSATWWALSRTPQSTEAPQVAAPQPVATAPIDSVRKKDTIAVRSRSTTRQVEAAPEQAKPFVPSEQDIPTPTGPLESRVKDSATMHVKVK